MSEIQLPKGWVWKKLGEIAEIVVGYVGPITEYLTSQGSGIPLLSTTHIGVNKFIENEVRFVNRDFAISNKKSLVQPGNILIARHGDSGKSCIVPNKYPAYQVSNAVIARVTPYVALNKFICYYLNYQREIMQEGRVGAVFQVVNTKKMSDFLVLLPPLPVQQAIVARIEELFSELEAGTRELQTALDRLKIYRQAVLHHYLNNPDWKRVKLGDLKTFSMYGPRFSKENYSSNGVVVLRTTDIDNRGKVDTAKAPKIDLTDKEFEKYQCRKGDVLITRTGSIGTYTIFNDDTKAIPGAFLIQYRVDERINLDFLFYILALLSFSRIPLAGSVSTS